MGMHSHRKAMKFGMGLGEAFRGNTLISTLVGAGIGWLMAKGAEEHEMSEGMKEKMAKMMEAKKAWMAKKKGEEGIEEGKEYLKEFKEQAEKWAKEFGSACAEQCKKAYEGVKEIAEEKPVVLAAASAAVAALIGLGIWQLVREKE